MQNKCLGGKAAECLLLPKERTKATKGPAYITHHSGVVNQVSMTPAAAAIT